MRIAFPSRMFSSVVLFLSAISTVMLSGCASSPPGYENAMNASNSIKANSSVIQASMQETWSHILLVLPRQGFIIKNVNDSDRVITASRDITNTSDEDTSYKVTVSATVVPIDKTKTEVIVSANRDTIVHHVEHTWWHLLWLIPLFPTGTQYTTVVTASGTIESPHFYDEFFKSLKGSIKASKVGGNDKLKALSSDSQALSAGTVKSEGKALTKK